MFLPLNNSAYAKFSFEKGALPMPILPSGAPDGRKAINWGKKYIAPGAVNLQLRKVFRNLIRKRERARYNMKKVSPLAPARHLMCHRLAPTEHR